MKKQTAVEWLEEIIAYKDMGEVPMWIYELFDQAKAMEKEQIIDAYHINPLESKWKNIGADYYTQTFTEPKND
jgi:hypothetical protein